jgi:hypothetical protein
VLVIVPEQLAIAGKFRRGKPKRAPVQNRRGLLLQGNKKEIKKENPPIWRVSFFYYKNN